MKGSKPKTVEITYKGKLTWSINDQKVAFDCEKNTMMIDYVDNLLTHQSIDDSQEVFLKWM